MEGRSEDVRFVKTFQRCFFSSSFISFFFFFASFFRHGDRRLLRYVAYEN